MNHHGTVRLPVLVHRGITASAFPSRPVTTIKTGDHETSRFSRMMIYVHAWALRPRRVPRRLAKAPPRMLPSARLHSVGTPNQKLRGSITPPARPVPISFLMPVYPGDSQSTQRRTRA